MRKLMAVIISWNPDPETLRGTLRAMQEQGVEMAIIVDNNSNPEGKQDLKTIIAEFPKFTKVIWNERNGGIGGALNPGVREAMAHGAEWIMTIEDDNTPEPGMIATMFAAYDALPPEDRAKVGTMAPNYTRPYGFAFPDGPAQLNDDGAITSGEIVRTDVYKKIGFYDEKLFIDYVDGEFRCRLYLGGFKSLLVPRAILRHRAGHPSTRRFLWKTAVIPNYPPLRYYFMARNSIYLYFWNFPTYIVRNNHRLDAVNALIFPRYLIKVVLFEDQKWKKLRMAGRGFLDGFLRRMDLDYARRRANLAP